MPPDGFDPHDTVELRVSGDFVDVVGLVTAVRTGLADIEADFEGLDRATKVTTDLAQQVNEQVNFGLVERELRRLVNNDEGIEYRGIQAVIDEFDPKHPDPPTPGVEKLSPLDEAEAYVVVSHSPEGYEMAGYPERFTQEQSLRFASLLRIYARDIETVVADDSRGGLDDADAEADREGRP